MTVAPFQRGELVAVGLRNRRVGLIQVVRAASDTEMCHVVGRDWYAKEQPSLAEARATPLLTMTVPSYGGRIFAARLIRSALPNRMVSIGMAPVSPDLDGLDYAADQTRWKSVPATLLRLYQYANDPKARARLDALPSPGAVYSFPFRDIEREAICNVLWLFGRAVGVENAQALVDEHRDW